MKAFILSILIFSPLIFANEYMSSLIVSDAKNHNVLGTAAHICFSYGQKTLYFVTAAHVVEGIDDLEGRIVIGKPSIPLKKLKVDSQVDLAVLVPDLPSSSVFLMGFALPCQETSRSSQLITTEAFDVLATSDKNTYRLDIEGFDSELNSLRTETVVAPVVKSIQSGIPGREATGQVYMTTFKAKAGFSGGVVVGYSSGGHLSPHTADQDYSRQPHSPHGLRREFLGIVVAADQARGRVAIIPGSKVMSWFRSKDSNRKELENTTTTLGGLYNRDLGAFISTPMDSMVAVGLSSFGGVGTGRPAVGKPIEFSAHDGIIVSEQKDKRWLSVSNTWVEGDPMSTETKNLIKNNGKNLDGIYKDSYGEIMKTPAAALPKIFNVEEINKILRQDLSKCSQIQMKDVSTQKLLDATICESIREKSANYNFESRDLNLKISMEDVNGKLEVSSQINDQPAQLLSLRRLQNARFNIKLEGLSGIEIQDRQTKKTWIGPVK